jgi:hypothetical protein
MAFRGQAVTTDPKFVGSFLALILSTVVWFVYPRSQVVGIQAWIDKGLLTYIDTKQSPQWFDSAGLQLPRDLRTTKGLQAKNIASEAVVVNDGAQEPDKATPTAPQRPWNVAGRATGRATLCRVASQRLRMFSSPLFSIIDFIIRHRFL